MLIASSRRRSPVGNNSIIIVSHPRDRDFEVLRPSGLTGPNRRRLPTLSVRLFQIRRRNPGEGVRPRTQLNSNSGLRDRPRGELSAGYRVGAGELCSPPRLRPASIRRQTPHSFSANINESRTYPQLRTVRRDASPQYSITLDTAPTELLERRENTSVMAFCHACHRPTEVAERINNEPICERCGMSGFVELLTPTRRSQTSQDMGEIFGVNGHNSLNPSEVDDRDPFRPIEMLFNSFLTPSLNPPRMSFAAIDGDASFSFSSNRSRPRRTPLNDMIPATFIPDAIAQILTGNNLPSILQLLMRQSSPSQYGPPPASATVRERLPRVIATQDNLGEQCPICQEYFKLREEIVRLTANSEECSHAYHPSCLLPWLESRNSCPVCRFELPTDDPEYEARKSRLRNDLETSMQSRTQAACSPNASASRNSRPTRAGENATQDARLRPVRPNESASAVGRRDIPRNNNGTGVNMSDQPPSGRILYDPRTPQPYFECGNTRNNNETVVNLTSDHAGRILFDPRIPQPYFECGTGQREAVRPVRRVVPHSAGLTRAVGSGAGAWRSTLSGSSFGRAQPESGGSSPSNGNSSTVAGNNREQANNSSSTTSTTAAQDPAQPALQTFGIPLGGIMNTWRSVWRMNADSSQAEISHNQTSHK